MANCPDKIKKIFLEYVDLCEENIEKHPYIVVILMHEYMRNLYPTDPYIPLDDSKHQLDVVIDVLNNNIRCLKEWASIGSYRIDFDTYKPLYSEHDDIKDRTGSVYGNLWSYYPSDLVEEAKNIILERFNANDISLDLIRGKTVLDAGCGSGRYTCALAQLGASEVVGLDFGEEGLKLGKRLAESLNLNNVQYKKGSLLDMPFPDNTFDFVFANGVFHHTGNIELGTGELYRVLKEGGNSWYFIYGDGGLYWYSRKIMNTLMKRIPQQYSVDILSSIGMPMNRFIFCDNWYVPIEEHTTNDNFVKLIKSIGFSSYRRAYKGRKTDFDYLVVNGTDKDRSLWGDGNLRYLLVK